MISLVVTFCMTFNPTMCRTAEFVPESTHTIISIPECIRGGAIGGMHFTLEHTEWFTKGWRCKEHDGVVTTWLRSRQ